MDSQENKSEAVIQGVSFTRFFESIPPNKLVRLEPAVLDVHGRVKLSNITLHCDGEDCNGNRFFSPKESYIYVKESDNKFSTYVCNNCKTTFKVFAYAVVEDGDDIKLLKFGEIPPFGPPTPSKLIELIRPDKEFFLLGRRCENQGFGIGAFVYYRRVVEDHDLPLLVVPTVV